MPNFCQAILIIFKRWDGGAEASTGDVPTMSGGASILLNQVHTHIWGGDVGYEPMYMQLKRKIAPVSHIANMLLRLKHFGARPKLTPLPPESRPSKTFQDGVYTGEFDDKGQRHGNGVTQYNNSDVYTGGWLNDKKNGKYTYKEDDRWPGRSYEGDWKDDKKSGWGQFIFSDKHWYEGGCVNDKMEGNGTERWKYSVNDEFTGSYTGSFLNNHYDGKGVMDDRDGVYNGEWKKNMTWILDSFMKVQATIDPFFSQ